MLRTTAAGNDSGRYTNGNPGLGQPATVVDDTAMNFHQEEIVNAVLRAGLTLSSDENQLADAIEAIAGKGGAQVSFTVANNVSVAADVTGLVFDKTTVKAARILYALERSDDSPNVKTQIGELLVVHEAANDAWRINDTSSLDDAGVVFSVTSAGQVQYTSSNFTGGTYAGTLKTSITRVSQ